MRLSDLNEQLADSIRAHHGSGHFDHDTARLRLTAGLSISDETADNILRAPIPEHVWENVGRNRPVDGKPVACEACGRVSVCGIVSEFLGQPLPPCDRPGTVPTEGRCELGHVRKRVVCDDHADAFRAMPDAIDCAECHESGITSRSTLTIGGAA